MHLDIERRLAIADLLARPDPPDLARRTHRLRFEGKPDRFEMVPRLAAAFVQQKLLFLHERRAEGLAANMCLVPPVARQTSGKLIPFAA